MFIILSTQFYFLSYCQNNKRNNNWTLGFSPVIKFDFNSSILVIDSFCMYALSTGSACISDTNGELAFSTSGFAIIDKNGELMPNGLDINCPKGNILATHLRCSRC